jgi:hypothetical protein
MSHQLPFSRDPDEPAWLPALRKRVIDLVGSEFEGCDLQRVITANFKAEYDRLWNALETRGAELLMERNTALQPGQDPTATLPEVFNNLLDEFEAGRWQPF